MRLQQLIGLALAFAPVVAAAQEVDDMEMRFALFDQSGHGYQSVAGPVRGPGSEDALIFEPQFHLRVRQDEHWSHDIDVTVDIVSNASIDAIDAVSTASAVNEAANVEVTSSYRDGAQRWDARYGFHIEEPLRSGFLGGGWTLSLADDNATIGVSGQVTVDFFDPITRTGYDPGMTDRESLNANLAASQILSPTTVADVAYGFTLQTGRLDTTYNSVPLTSDMRDDEFFPGGRRARHAFAARIAQHVPWTRTTLKASYRYYVDNYDLQAHTAEGLLYQYLCDWLYVRASYRYHHQTGVDFFATVFEPRAFKLPQTSDSDLAPFTAHEVGLKLVLLAERSPWVGLKRSFIEASFYRYWRTNDLAVNWLTLAFGRKF
jgi:hypothetical protein